MYIYQVVFCASTHYDEDGDTWIRLVYRLLISWLVPTSPVGYTPAAQTFYSLISRNMMMLDDCRRSYEQVNITGLLGLRATSREKQGESECVCICMCKRERDEGRTLLLCGVGC